MQQPKATADQEGIRPQTVSVSVSFSPVHDSSDETRPLFHIGDQPPMNAGEHRCTQPIPNNTVGNCAHGVKSP
jgi:hypothetical protein